MTALADIPPEKRKIGPLVWLSLLTPILFVVVLLVYEIVSPIRLTVVNHSDRQLTDITVAIQKHRIKIPDLAPGQGHRQWFRNQRETDSYTLTAKLGEEERLEETQGELRSGMIHGFYGPAIFTVNKDGSVSFSEN